MLRTHIASLILSICVAAPLAAQTSSATLTVQSKPKLAAVDPNKFGVIINGAGGEEVYAQQFEQWTKELSTVLVNRYGFSTSQLRVLTEKPSDPSASKSTAEEVRKTFAALNTELKPENVLFVFMIGHGSFDGKDSKFNLIGPDISAAEYNSLLNALPTKRVVLLNMASASGEFVKGLSTKGRIVITATRNGQETNATRFPGFFIAALKATDADTDQDGHISMLEAFVYANRLTADFYTRAGRLATEHALIEDNGDGVGREKADSGEGLLARATYLDSLSLEAAAANVATAKLLKERNRLEGEIEQWIGRKGNLGETEYDATLEKLFIDLAKVNRSIKQGS